MRRNGVIFSIFCNMKVCCVDSLESPDRLFFSGGGGGGGGGGGVRKGGGGGLR